MTELQESYDMGQSQGLNYKYIFTIIVVADSVQLSYHK